LQHRIELQPDRVPWLRSGGLTGAVPALTVWVGVPADLCASCRGILHASCRGRSMWWCCGCSPRAGYVMVDDEYAADGTAEWTMAGYMRRTEGSDAKRAGPSATGQASNPNDEQRHLRRARYAAQAQWWDAHRRFALRDVKRETLPGGGTPCAPTPSQLGA
jgi:hypothetical protein